MKNFKTFLFVVFNLLGFSTLSMTIIYYIETFNSQHLIAGFTVSVLIIVCSILIGLKSFSKESGIPTTLSISDDAPDNNNSNDLPQVSNFEDSKAIPLVEQIIEEEIDDKTSSVSNNFSNYIDPLIKLMNEHETSLKLPIIDVLKPQFNKLLNDMDLYGKVEHTQCYDYRLESLLKNGIVDVKIRKVIYRPFPYVSVTKQKYGPTTLFQINVGVHPNKFTPLGYLPDSISPDLIDSKKIFVTPISGTYKEINSSTLDFKTVVEDDFIIVHFI